MKKHKNFMFKNQNQNLEVFEINNYECYIRVSKFKIADKIFKNYFNLLQYFHSGVFGISYCESDVRFSIIYKFKIDGF